MSVDPYQQFLSKCGGLRETTVVDAPAAFALHQKSRDTIRGFSEKLERLYEEVNLLYRLAGIVKLGDGVNLRLQTALAEIAATMPFRWMTLCFSERSPRIHPALRGITVQTGEPPVDAEVCRKFSERLIRAELEASKSIVLVGDAIPAGWGPATEILAEPINYDSHVVGVILAAEKLGPDPDLSSEDIQIMDAVTAMLSAFHENATRYAEQESLLIATIQALGRTLEAKDPYTRGHSERVAHLATQLALALGFSSHQADRYRVLGLVHDLGKVGVPEAILCKPGKLTNEEYALMQQHPTIGHRILKDIAALEDILPGVLHHHERWDGRGYPQRLAGENIPQMARILALADSFDAMSSNRSYRSALSRQQTLDEIVRCGGSQFDPALVSTFVDMDFSAFDAMLQFHRQSIAA